MKDFFVVLIHSTYNALHKLRVLLIPSFRASDFKLLNLLIGKIMDLKTSKVKTLDGTILQLDKKDSLSLSFNRIYETVETSLVKQSVKPEMVIIDIGANIGYFTTLFSKLAYKGKVIAFEPDMTNFKILEKNCRVNKCTNVQLFNNAVGSETCTRRLYISSENHGDHRLYPVDDQRESVEVETIDIDSHLKSEEAIDFIKMDIQGFEMEALLGMKQTISIYFPTLLLELWPSALLKNKTNPLDLMNYLIDLQYSIYDVIDIDKKICPSQFNHWIESIQDHTNIFCTRNK